MPALPYTQDTSANNSNQSQYPSTVNPRGGLINSPAIDEKGKPKQRAIRDASMARDICRTLVMAGKNRSIVNARILAKQNAERPYESGKLESEGLGWRSNFTTKPMPTWIEKIVPRYVDAIQSLKYFTDAELSEKWDNSVEKTELFRTEITKTIRRRTGWRAFLENVAQTNVLFGYSVCAWLDEFCWFPVAAKQDEVFMSDGTKEVADFAQLVMIKETLLPHELFRQIKDKDAAESAGWNVENVIKAINNASPSQLRDNLNTGGTLESWYQSAWRELTIGASYMAGMSVIVIWSLLVREVDGKVSHYRLAGTELDEVFSRDDQFDSMKDCVAFFSFQKGNGTMHGSKGIGRELYELAAMIDRSRNEVVDRTILSGKTLIQGDLRQIHKFRMSVVGSTCIIPKEWTVLEQRIDGNIEPMLKLDAYFSALADQLIGSVSPPRAEGEAFRSPQAWQLLAQREEEGRDAKMSRWMEQFVLMIEPMQRKLCDPDTVEEDAKEMQKRILEKMSREELDELANGCVANTIKDLTPIDRQMIVSVCAEKKGNPLFNQRQLEIEDLTARTSSGFIKRVLLPENDPTDQAEQLRLQQMEMGLLTQGQPVPVSPRDNHMTHLSVVVPFMEKVAAAMQAGQAGAQVFEAVVSHAAEHVTRAEQAGADKVKLKPIKDIVTKCLQAVQKLHEMDAKAHELAAQDQQLHEGQPGMAPPDQAPLDQAAQNQTGQPPPGAAPSF